jgi:hypothetical protein
MRWARLTSLVLLAIVLLIAIAVTVLVNLDPNRFKGNLERFVAAQTDRTFKITGSLDIDLGRHTHLTISGVHLGNPQWASIQDMVQLDKLALTVDLFSLFDGPFVIELLELSGARIHLEKNPDGEDNWTFGGKTESDPKTDSKPIPLILRIARIDDFQLTYLDSDLLTPLQLKMVSLEQTQTEAGLFEATLDGAINTRPVAVSGQYGPLDSLLTGLNFEYQVSGKFDTLTITSGGSIDNLLQPHHPEFTLSVNGPDIDHVTDMLGLTDLGSGGLDVEASVRPRDDRLEAQVHGNLGEFLIDMDAFASALTDLRTAQLTIRASGPNLGQVERLFGTSVLPDDPFELDGNITRSGRLLTIEQLELNIGGSRFNLDGSMSEFPKLRGSTLDLTIVGTDIARFREILNLPGVVSGPFNAAANLKISPEGTELLDLSIRTSMAETRISGTLGEPPEYQGTIMDVEISGKNLQDLGNAYDISTLIAGPFNLTGKVEFQEREFITHEKIRISAGDNRLEISGTVGFDFLESDTDIQLSASGPDLRQIAAMAYINESIPAKPYGVRGRLQVVPDGYRVHKMEARIGEAEIGIDGLISRKADFAGSSVTFQAAGPDLEHLLADTRQFDVPPGPFRATGKVRLEVDEIEVENVEIDAAGAELRGDANIVLPTGWSDIKSSNGVFEVSASGPDLSAVLPEFDFYQPDASVFKLQALGKWDEDRWSFDAVKIEIDDARLDFSGKLDQPPDWSATELNLDANIGNLAKLGLINGRRLPAMPFELRAHFTGTPGTFEMDELTARLGESDFSGQIAISLQKQIPGIDIRIQSNRLDIDAFATQYDQPAELEEDESSEVPDDDRLIPDREIRLDILRKFDAQLALEAQQLLFQEKEYRDLALYADVTDGMLNVHRAEASGDNGELTATFVAEPENDAAKITGSLRGTDLYLGVFGQSGDDVAIAPRIEAKIDLTGTGHTVHELVGTLTGKARFTSNGGRTPNSKSGSFIFGDFFAEVFTAVNPFAKEDPYTEVVCIAILLDATNGKLAVDPGIVVQTNKMNIVSTGLIDLVTEKIDLNFRTASRGRIGISAGQFINPYIKVAGTLANPKLTLDPQGTLVSGGAAVATLGLSILAKTAWDRVFRSKDPCGTAIAEADKRQKD